jgi:hypothetical protein
MLVRAIFRIVGHLAVELIVLSFEGSKLSDSLVIILADCSSLRVSLLLVVDTIPGLSVGLSLDLSGSSLSTVTHFLLKALQDALLWARSSLALL